MRTHDHLAIKEKCKNAIPELMRYFQLGIGRTLIVRKLGELKKNPELVESGVTRSRIKSRKYRFMGEL